MTLPNLSNMVNVGQLRHIQSAYEDPEHTNPDALIHHFLSPAQLWSCRLRGTLAIERLRSNPFYYYVLARTHYYDAVFSSAISEGMQYILNIGCGSDTRAYRYAGQLRDAGISCVECDQEEAILSKEKLARGKLNADHVQYMPIDLNATSWPSLESWLSSLGNAKVLVMMEGVSPYISHRSFNAFLRLLSSRMSRGSRVAYDFKLKGVADEFGRGNAMDMPFRLGGDAGEVERFHAALGLKVNRFELGANLVARMVPGLTGVKRQAFTEDALLQISLDEAIH